jgi:N4-gp56 family major capsid protein
MKNPGDTMTIPLAMQLSADPILGDATAEGNEEAQSMYDQSVTVQQKRFPWRSEGMNEEQKSAYDVREQAKWALGQRIAVYEDTLWFTKMATSMTSTEIVWTGSNTAVNTIAATDKLTLANIQKAKRKAEMHAPLVEPIMVDGKPLYIFFAHTYAMRDLWTDSSFLNAHYYANLRGDKNPLISGAEVLIDGILIYEHTRVKLATDGAASANVAYNFLAGKNCGVKAEAKAPFWKEKWFDYDNQLGILVGTHNVIEKTKYNSKDYGVIHVPTGGAAD